MKENNVACDVISFGDPYMDKRDLFEALIRSADKDGNCNVCHVPPESSVPEALSRSQIIIPRRVGGGSGSAPPSTQNKMPIEICVKAPPRSHATVTDANTDCPFCQRVLLTLLEKKLPYRTHLIDLDNKPEWFAEANPDGLLPLIRFDDEKWVSNSDVIVEMIEKKYPEPPLETPPYYAYLALKILPKLLAFLKNKNDDTQQALVFELMELEHHLSEYGGPYVNGKDITAVDLSLAPKLYHLVEACKENNEWNIPKKFTKVLNYNKLLFNRTSFKKTKPSPESVNEGWRQRLRMEPKVKDGAKG
ncbi:dehydroascorbate reductase 2 [Artemisia annua]|uniref:glutathione transferase n=1 Tax=Artemisia annua TaxID=35608 RepID=A0A2U1NNN8_ARTAN|nr:dehydroascorbate reductase 2 [Artemisia annua]